ncbi:EamA family transporter [Bengtsoniella intestinalis]|uniref:DMT family transporter n=1 Tax=Bengtsoniella intestinalis TaxID=3073143 RepID=UPI00391F17CE
MKPNAKSLPTFAILAAAICWGVIGLWSLQLLSAGLSPYSIVAVRNCGGLVLLLAIFAIKDPSVFKIDPKDIKYFFGTGIVSVLLFTVCYFSCQQMVSLSVAAILLYTAPSIVVVMSAILWKEPITKAKLAALVLTFFGACCVSGVFAGELVAPLMGILLGLGAGFFYAMYSIFGRYALEKYPPMTVTVWTFIFCGTGALLIANPTELVSVLSQGYNWALALGLVVISTVAPYILYTYGLSYTEAGKASIMASLEPVTACVIGVAVFGETMDLLSLLGIVAVLAGVYLLKDG